jgi:hypothetical protein
MKKNCWEYKKCGREPGGDKVNELGVCMAAAETKMNGIHSGKNGGRACWVLSGTLCGGDVQGTFAAKMSNCLRCEFFKEVSREEKGTLKTPKELISLL